MSAHTPGPWEKKFDSLRVQTVAEPKLAICYTHMFGTSGAQAGANARLIAAAPTMRNYIERKVAKGDQEARKILETIDGNA